MAGSLTLNTDDAHIFDDGSLQLGRTFATQLALAWNTFQRDEQFRSALASRDPIDQAEGIVMERLRVDAVGSARS
ncbi:MAG: ANTAR domain-containing protein [Mycobacterium sp.]|nr:ANTAR domain-containing protein [Mycobacterium sp.]